MRGRPEAYQNRKPTPGSAHIVPTLRYLDWIGHELGMDYLQASSKKIVLYSRDFCGLKSLLEVLEQMV